MIVILKEIGKTGHHGQCAAQLFEHCATWSCLGDGIYWIAPMTWILRVYAVMTDDRLDIVLMFRILFLGILEVHIILQAPLIRGMLENPHIPWTWTKLHQRLTTHLMCLYFMGKRIFMLSNRTIIPKWYIFHK